MKEIKVSIHQPEYLPYRGHFFKISQADIHIFLDDVQAERNAGAGNGWQYRNKFPDGYHNAPKKKIHLGDKINEVQVPEMGMSLADWNIPLITTISRELGYKTIFLRSSLLDIGEFDGPNDRLVKLVKSVGGTSYIAGSGGHNYMDFSYFEKACLKLYFMEFEEEDYLSTFWHIQNEGCKAVADYIKTHGKLTPVNYADLKI